MKIGELASMAQCTVETIRYYEKEGLLPETARTEGNYRHYGQTHLDRLRFIRNCRALDMTHGEIRALLALMDQPQDDCHAVNGLIEEHIRHVNLRIAELSQLQQQLQALRHQCQTAHVTQDCPILQELVEMAPGQKGERCTHLG